MPLGEVEHLKLERRINKLLTAAIEHVNKVVNFDSLVQNASHQVSSVWCPLDTYSTIGARLTNLLQLFERPDIDFTFQVAEASNQKKLREGTYSDRVSITFAKFKKSITVFIVKCCDGRLVACNDYELLARFYPVHIINHILKDRDKLSFSATENLHILQAVLAVITLARSIRHVLRPDQGCVASRVYTNSDLLPLMTLNHEF